MTLPPRPVPTSPPPSARPRRSAFPWLVTTASLAFALGLIANPWFERTVRDRLPGADRVDPLAARIEALEARASRTGPAPADLATRLARLEARLAAPAPIAGPAVPATPLARARHAVATGIPTDVLAELQARYGPSEDVAAVSALAARPVTAARLRAGLAGLGSTPATPPAASSWADRARDRLSSLVTVRSAADARTDTTLAQAATALDAQNVPAAYALVARLPHTPARAAWAADARRLLEGRAALARLESAAPRAPGSPQPAPAAPPAPAPSTTAPAPPSSPAAI